VVHLLESVERLEDEALGAVSTVNREVLRFTVGKVSKIQSASSRMMP